MAAAATKPTDDKKASGSPEYQLRKFLLLLATLVATVTYAAGLNLPGGVWQGTEDGHLAGDVILRDTHYARYIVFYYCNATAFAASLVVCLLLLVLHSQSKYLPTALRVVMLVDLLCLMGAYASGSCRDTFTIIYSAVIMSAIFAYILPALFFYALSIFHNRKQGGAADVEINSGNTDQHRQYRRDDQHEVLMLLATFAIAITYVAGLNPPGGSWGDTQEGQHRASDPILRDNNSRRYQAFFVCNTTAFVASLLTIMLLRDEKLVLSYWLSGSKKIYSASLRYLALHGFIVIVLCGLAGAYAAGSCRELDTTLYIIFLIAAVLAYILFLVAITNGITEKAPHWLQSIKNFFVEPEDRTDSSDDTKGTKSSTKIFVEPEASTGSSDDTKSWDKKDSANEALEKARNLVMLLATLVASITYQAGLDPPGGLWPDDRDGHNGGDAVLLTTHPARYKVFFYSNSAAFVASLVVIIMVQSRYLLMRHTLEAAMLLDLFGLIGAYAAGSSRSVSTSIYVVSLVGLVLVYVVIHIVFFTLDHEKERHKDASMLDNRRDVLLLLAILVATLTYQAGLTPPGGFWLDETSGHHAGFPVLQDNHPHHYTAFFYCNAMSFMASVALIVLLVNPNLYKPGIRCYALYVCMVVGMVGVMGAYAAGSSRQLHTSIYVLTLVAAVFAFVVLLVVVFFFFPQWIKIEPSANTTRKNEPSGRKVCHHGGAPSPELDGQGEIIIDEPSVSHDLESSTTLKNKDISTKEEMEKNLREYLMLLGVLAASVTYQTGLKPPGGLWQDNSNGHIAGNSILRDMNRSRYRAFFYSNSTSFMVSIVVVVLLLSRTLHNQNLPLWTMHTAIVLNMLGLLGAYAAGSTTDWDTSMNVIYLVIPVLAYIVVYAAWPFLCEAATKAKAMYKDKVMQKDKAVTASS